MRLLNKIIVFALLLLASCSGNENIARIDTLQRRLDADEKTLLTLVDKDFPALISEYKFCDSVYAFRAIANEQRRKEMQIAASYLQQFQNEYPNLQTEINYTRSQLSNLKDDINTQAIQGEFLTNALYAETRAADKTHNMVLYFQTRFEKQYEVFAQIKNELNIEGR